MRRLSFNGFAAIFLMCVVSALAADNAAEPVCSQESGWPQFRGVARDGVSTESGLLKQWPEGGPELLWEVSELGRGYSSPIITDGAIFITGDVGDKLVIFAFDLDGSLIWKTTNGDAWTGPWPGARASCTYYDGRLYHANAHGRVVALDPETGKELWAVDTLKKFAGENIKWALSECLLIDDGKVYVTPGGKDAFMAALDAESGQTVWQSPPLEFSRTYVFGGKELEEPVADSDNAGYASPILFRMGDRKILARTSGQHAVCLDASSGAILWKEKIYARYEVLGAIPVLADGSI